MNQIFRNLVSKFRISASSYSRDVYGRVYIKVYDGKRMPGVFWRFRSLGWWWARRDSNPQPSGYEPPALTIELQARALCGRHSEERNGSLVVRKRAVTQKMVVSKRCRNGYTIAVQLSLLFHSFRCKEPILCARQRSGRINVRAGHYNVSADLKS